MKIPEGYNVVMPYLIVKNAAMFLEFTKKVFSAKEKFRVNREGTSLIMHAEIDINGSVIMFADATGQLTPQPAGLFIYVPDADEAYKKALAEGAASLREVADLDYGRGGGVTDPFGNTWWVTTAK